MKFVLTRTSTYLDKAAELIEFGDLGQLMSHIGKVGKVVISPNHYFGVTAKQYPGMSAEQLELNNQCEWRIEIYDTYRE